MTESSMKTVRLDLTGLSCPLPVLRARKAVTDLAAGDVLEVLATDRDAPKDFETFCEAAGHRLVSCTEHDGVFTIVVRLGG